MIAGPGTGGEPAGILGALSVGTGTSLTWPNVCALVKAVEAANGVTDPARTGFAVAPDTAEILRTRDKATDAGEFILADGRIDGRPAVVSNSVRAGTLVYGDWSGVAIAQWGVLEVAVMSADPGSTLFRTGRVGIRALYSCDVLTLRPESFAAVVGIT